MTLTCRHLLLWLIMGSGVLLAKAQGQDKSLALLESRLTQARDTHRVEILNKLGWEYRNSNLPKSLKYINESIELARSIRYEAGLVVSLNFAGVVHRKLGNYDRAMSYLFECLKVAERLKDQEQTAYAFNNMGEIYNYQRDHDNAEKYIRKAIAIFEELNNRQGIAYGYLRLGEVEEARGNYDQALRYFNECAELRLSLDDRRGLATVYASMGNIYLKKMDGEEALRYAQKSLQLHPEEDMSGKAQGLRNLAEAYFLRGQLSESEKYARQSLQMGQQFQSKKIAQEASALLARIYALQLDYPRAFQYQTQNMLWRDSLFTEETSRIINNLRESYESEKQTLEIENLKNIQKIQAEENRLQAILLYGTGVALVLISTILLLLYRNYRYNQKITRQIEAQKEEITQIAETLQTANGEISEQKKVIEKKNFDLTSSITYAKRIQEALLPPHEELVEALQNYFVMYRPRDIVSGDFYWVAQKKYKTILAVADCTGHGIPGAFMSMIGNDLLNEIVVGRNITEPDKILEELRRRVRKVLRQQKTKNHDGMDIAICTIEQYPPGYEEILGTPKLEYAGAENSLFYFENGNPQLLELKGSKAIIGGFNVLQQDRPFIKHTLLLEAHRLPLTFYLYTDGYQDQFGPKGKFMRRRFRELLSRIHTFDLDTQKEMVEQNINDWLGDHAQIDDMLVMGVKISNPKK